MVVVVVVVVLVSKYVYNVVLIHAILHCNSHIVIGSGSRE